MQEVEVKFKRLTTTAVIPSYTRPDDACLDLTADENIIIPYEGTCMVSTGIAMEIPHGYEGRVRGRSGLSSKGICVHHGTIDEQYRGEVKVIITNNTGKSFNILKGTRIAQLSINPVNRIVVLEVDEVSNTERGTNGFGSSDRPMNLPEYLTGSIA